jgi:hypothetical protein
MKKSERSNLQSESRAAEEAETRANHNEEQQKMMSL